MIMKLEDGKTLITLGEGTVYTGNAYSENRKKPFGIAFTNNKELSNESIIFHLPNINAVASYLMALVNFLESVVDDGDMKEVTKSIHQLKQGLEKILSKEK